MNNVAVHALLVGAGFLAGTAGIAALKSKPAHDLAVACTVQGMRAKEGYKSLVEEAKAQFDDIQAEADYKLSQSKAAKAAE